ncbi:13076_t:CDS:2 [Acaulospora colombiana]|uniref:13076_t:CDS:1 n=1 Tax=Acaulospora colombiana TaxID=27376 RepID=A0ACA9L903_9GLOM|nr:13076_t:CDS:2 [Acaulospora colombiana]
MNHAWLFVKDPDTNIELEKKVVKIDAFKKRWPGQGFARFIQRKKIGDKATFGVEFGMFSIHQKEVHLLPPNSFPSDLRDAWSDQLDSPTSSDVHFNINGHSLYASKDDHQLESAVEIYSIADKYLIGELRSRSLQKIWECLTDDNAAEVLFTFGSQWPDLKETVMDYVVTRFKSVRKTEGYLRIEKNNAEYPGASTVYAELLQKLIPDN